MAVDERNIETQFLRALELAGIEPRNELRLEMDGKIHRFAVEGDRGLEVSGAYCIHTDGVPAGYFQDWRKDIKENWKYDFSDEERREYARENHTPDERERQRRETEARKAEEKKHQEENQQRATARALDEYERANAWGLDEHPYIISKHVEKLTHFIFEARIKAKEQPGDFCLKGDLLIPINDAITGEFRSLQRIAFTPNKDGKFYKGMYKNAPLENACCDLISRFRRNPFTGIIEAEHIFICEGVATGLSVLELNGKKDPVICAMSAGKILNIAKIYRTRYPNLEIIIAADHDKAGLEAAEKAIAAGYADKEIHPPKEGDDWNDYINHEKGYF